ncbi:MAG: FtsQ-type POTRA domain-containing protein [Candidatus Magasanikbacteria bacterium]
MQYFQSDKSFNQYKPHQSFWQKLKSKRQKKETANCLQQSTLKNPFKKDKPTSKNKTRLILVLFIILICSWAVLMLTLPYFKINKIIITGNKITKATEVENYVRQFNFSRTNYFLFPEKSIAEKIKQVFLYENTEIKKVFPNTIQITVVEKPTSVIYDNNYNYYLLDSDGKIIKQLNEYLNIPEINVGTSTINTSTFSTNTHLNTYKQIEAAYGNFPVIFNDKSTVEINKEKNLLLPKIIKTAIEWEKYLDEQGVGEVQYFEVGDTDFNLKVFLKQPWYILINTDLDLQVQMQNLKIILSKNKPTEYIDLRFGERVYWK